VNRKSKLSCWLKFSLPRSIHDVRHQLSVARERSWGDERSGQVALLFSYGRFAGARS